VGRALPGGGQSAWLGPDDGPCPDGLLFSEGMAFSPDTGATAACPCGKW
jgi:hypothetical protein